MAFRLLRKPRLAVLHTLTWEGGGGGGGGGGGLSNQKRV